jgi:hypothetical protein
LAWGGWLQLKWTPVLLSAKPDALDPILGEAGATVSDGAYQDRTRVFRDNFTSYFLRIVIGWTWWLGAIVGVFLLWRRGNVKDGPWGLIAGAAAGVVGGATVGCAVIIGDLGPHLIFDSLFSSKESGLLLLPLWGLLTAIWWGCLGCSLGFCLTLLGPFGRPLLYPFQVGLAGTFRVLGLRQFAEFFAPL